MLGACIDLPFSEAPRRENDTNLERAILGHEYTEPVRWPLANVLVLERHQYYEKISTSCLALYRFAAEISTTGSGSIAGTENIYHG